jgi:ferredoxin/flavodoxin---NADP+ reductase
MGGEYNATLVGRIEVAPGLDIMRVAPDERPFDYKSGQYVVLGMKATEARVAMAAEGPNVVAGDQPAGTSDGQSAVDAQAAATAAADPDRMIKRAFCIASESRAEEYLEFYLTLISSGELTPRLFNLKVGDRLFVGSKAEGIFTIDKGSSKSVLMIATGTGLAPYMSMIRRELGVDRNGHLGVRAVWQCNGSRQFAILHGARYSWDLGYRTELMGLARHCSNFHYLPVVTRLQEDPTWQGRTGYLQNLIAAGVIEKETGLAITPDNFDVFLCGNPDMIDSVLTWAEGRGFTRDKGHQVGNLHTEKFW